MRTPGCFIPRVQLVVILGGLALHFVPTQWFTSSGGWVFGSPDEGGAAFHWHSVQLAGKAARSKGLQWAARVSKRRKGLGERGP